MADQEAARKLIEELRRFVRFASQGQAYGEYCRAANEAIDKLVVLASPGSEMHADCHDLVCNGDRRHPRGAKGVGCSCRGREERRAAEYDALRLASPGSVSDQGWRTMESAPKGGGAEMTTDPAWVEPPRILALVDGEIHITSWDWYYAEGGNGYRSGQQAWVDASEGYPFNPPPTHWMPLPAPPVSPAQPKDQQ